MALLPIIKGISWGTSDHLQYPVKVFALTQLFLRASHYAVLSFALADIADGSL